MGADIRLEHGFVVAEAPRLQGATIRTDMITVTGTENLLMAAVLAQGETVIENAAQEPEIADLAELLIAMGARIQGPGTDRIVVQGVDQLHGATYAIMPDRIETGTFLCTLGATGGALTLLHTQADTLTATINKLRQAGLSIELHPGRIEARMTQRPQAISFSTSEHPGLPTDMQAQLMALNAIAQGNEVIAENIFENRFMHVKVLRRIGAEFVFECHNASVRGYGYLFVDIVLTTDE